MILIHSYTPSPRTIWYNIYSTARDSKHLSQADRTDNLSALCLWIESKYNIDSDYLMETMGRYALSIT